MAKFRGIFAPAWKALPSQPLARRLRYPVCTASRDGTRPMSADKSQRPTGYPPVTDAEERVAASGRSTDPGTAGAARLGANGKIVIDALATVFDEHRKRIEAASIEPVIKRHALNLLDGLFLDILQTVLSERA